MERRMGKRPPLTLKVYWTTDGRGVEEAETGDVSEVGCFLMTGTRAKVGEMVDMRTELATGARLHLRGEVTHQLEVGFGVEFRTMGDDERRELAVLLEEHHERNRRLGPAGDEGRKVPYAESGELV
jgi:hypothetical protein